MKKESDHTISLYTETEVIETTAQHPFYVNNEWKDASELQPGDKIQTKNKQEIEIKSTQFKYEPKKFLILQCETGILILWGFWRGWCIMRQDV